MAKIKEDEITNFEDFEIGGLQKIDIAAFAKGEKRNYEVKQYEVVETEWGKRIDFTISDAYQEWILSSWNITSKRRFKPVDIVGRTVTLEGYSEKKVMLTF